MPHLDTGNTGFMLLCSSLVMLMTPGLAFFDDRGAYHPYRYHHPLGALELKSGLETAGFRVEGMKSFLWLMKTMPDLLLGAGQAAERVAESTSVFRRFGATTLIWATRS